MIDHCHCGCCAGVDSLPPVRHNPPGAPAIGYRAGVHASFKAALLARLSSTDYPALGALRTRRDDDFVVAACDAAATLLDVLTFYQERYANEFYLRTATERRSLVELARLIGYRPSPGVAAGTRLAFMLEGAPGAPALAAEPVTIAAGTRVQSVPGPGEDPQTFETVHAVTARVEWNAIPIQTTERQTFAIGTSALFVSGVGVQIQPGDVVVVVGDERVLDAENAHWDARVVNAVERDNQRNVTRVTLAEGLGRISPPTEPASLHPRAYVFRQRAALFGHNAPDPNLLFHATEAPTTLTDDVDSTLVWENYSIQNDRIDLDNSYPRMLAGSWVLLTGGDGSTGLPSLPGLVDLCNASFVQHLSRSAFGLSGRITRITPDKVTNLSSFGLRNTVVFAQSEELPLAERPLAYPLYGTELTLGRLSELLKPGQEIAISGRRQRLRIAVEDSTLAFEPDGGNPAGVKPGDSFTCAAPPTEVVNGDELAVAPPALAVLLSEGTASLRWRLIDRNGDTGILDAPAAAVVLEAARDEDPVVTELRTIHDSATAVQHDRDRTTVQLASPLANVYDRSTATMCANLARATHGETVSEIAGSGSAASAGQSFTLKQSPLTYVSAASPDGRESTLEVRVNGLLWDEAATLFEQGPRAHVYALRQDGDGRTRAQFGDGIEGERLPTGRDNVRFTYRKFLGRAGNLDAGRLTTLLGRPLGVKSVRNVVPATGGDDPEPLEDARRNAPLTMLTLGRAVSIQDYTDFARSFAGIARAQAVWVGSGATRGIAVTVAGPDGGAVDVESDTWQNLTGALRDYGDPLVPLTVLSYGAVTFRMEATITVAAAAHEDLVVTAVDRALREHYAFAARDFGQHVTLDEVMAVMQGVTGVEGANVIALYRTDPGAVPSLTPRLFAFPARMETDDTIAPAELLTLDTASLALGVVP